MPLNPTDAHRGLKIDSPLGELLVCQTVGGTERMGRLFEFQLEILSLDLNIKFQDIVGQRVTITLELPEGERYFDGFVTEFRYAAPKCPVGRDGFRANRDSVRDRATVLTTQVGDS